MFVQYLKFALISGLGLLSAVGLFWLLADKYSVNVLISNVISDFVAVSLVFVLSKSTIFNRSNAHYILSFVLWILWQIIHIFAISLVLTYLERSQVLCHSNFPCRNVINKIAITPITMTLNFVVLRFITSKSLNANEKSNSCTGI